MFNWRPVKNIDYIVDYYQVLEIDPAATISDIKKQYKKLAKEYHPDKYQTAGEEIKKLSETKMENIIEAFSIIGDKNKKDLYDSQLAEFKKDKPNLISTTGTPIMDLSKESYSVDFIFSGEEKFAFQEEQEKKVAQLVSFNPTVFDMVQKAYFANPSDENLLEAYKQQMISKKVMIDFKEIFAWQNLGVMNSKGVKVQSSLEYKDTIKLKVAETIIKFNNLIDIRLLGTSEKEPLLLGSREFTKYSKDDAFLIKKEIANTLEDKITKVMDVAQEKQDFLVEFTKIRKYEKIKSNDKIKDFKVFLYEKESSLILTGFDVRYDGEEAAGIDMDSSFDNKNIKEVESNVTTYTLEMNPELDIVFQVVEFTNYIANGGV